MPSGEARAYIEDARTGNLAGYSVRDVVGDSRIEEIRGDRVVLRHGGEVVHLFLGGPAAAHASGNPMTASTVNSPLTSSVEPAPVIGNGEPWLDHLGIPPKALSRAIEKAFPPKASDNLEDY